MRAAALVDMSRAHEPCRRERRDALMLNTMPPQLLEHCFGTMPFHGQPVECLSRPESKARASHCLDRGHPEFHHGSHHLIRTMEKTKTGRSGDEHWPTSLVQ